LKAARRFGRQLSHRAARHRRRSRTHQLLAGTVASLFRYRVTGLAAEAAFFALLSLPPLVLGLVGTLGHAKGILGEATVADVRSRILELAGQALAPGTVDDIVRPMLDSVLSGGRVDIVSLAFLISLWSGSRAMNVYIDTISIAYGLGGRRSIVKTRALSFFLYLVGLAIGIVVMPMVLAGPRLVEKAFPQGEFAIRLGYWPAVIVLSITLLAGLYHAAVPVRTAWRRALPGAALALVMWLSGSAILRLYLMTVLDKESVYASLAAPVAILLWGYMTALAVLIGAALNAQIDRMWPSEATMRAREVETAPSERPAAAPGERSVA
jgi:membrane protein